VRRRGGVRERESGWLIVKHPKKGCVGGSEIDRVEEWIGEEWIGEREKERQREREIERGGK